MRWFYLRDKNRNPVACVASERYTSFKGTDHERECVAFAVSAHNPKDQYNKSMAREVAIGRLNKGLGATYSGSVCLVPEVKKLIIATIMLGDFPERAKKAAQLWLDTRKEIPDLTDFSKGIRGKYYLGDK